MVNEPKFITYYSTNAQPHEAWIAYIKPCACIGECNHQAWKVRCVGSTEDEAKNRALALWNGERARMAGQAEHSDKPASSDWSSFTPTTGHGNAGKVWMRHPEKGLKRVSETEVAALGEGWYRSGPRGK